MPIIIKDVDWKQTENTLTIKIPLRGIHPSKADIFYYKSYLKASFEQYFYEVFLLHPIDTKNSKCTLTYTHIVFELVKCEQSLWEKLELDTISKAEKQKLKQQYIDEAHKLIQEEITAKQNKKSELKRLAVSEQMILDEKQRQTIENIKKEEQETALKQMGLLKTSKQKSANKTKIKTSRKEVIKPPRPGTPPPIRASRIMDVSFTPREFPTPSRESRLEEENEWLRKQAEARRSVGFISEDIRPEERNPQFLKAKGDEFLKNRNYLGAVSAYSFGIKINNKFSDFYVGRAEAHLALGNYHKSVQDCSEALELMKPEVPSNLRERALCIGWRGIGLIKLGLAKQGINELKASLRLMPNEGFSSQLEEALDNFNDTTENK